MDAIAVDEEASLGVRVEFGFSAEELGQPGVGESPERAQGGGVEVTPDIQLHHRRELKGHLGKVNTTNKLVGFLVGNIKQMKAF